MPTEKAPVGDPGAYEEWAKGELEKAEEFYDRQDEIPPEQATPSPVLDGGGTWWDSDPWGDDDSGAFDNDGSD